MNNRARRRNRFRARSIGVGIAWVAAAGPAFGQDDGPTDVLTVRRASSPIDVDGALAEPAWHDARVVRLPFEVNAGNNVPASQTTECRITFDSTHFYFGCTAHDGDPHSIRNYLTDRDEVDEQDRVGILLDPFRDSRRAFGFVVTTSGVQSDHVAGLGDAGTAWDAIWDAAGARTADGFVVEAAIPFRSLRFPDAASAPSWNFLFWRNRPRGIARSFRSVPEDLNNVCRLCQLGTLTGLTGVRPGMNLELTPVVTAQRLDQRLAPDAPSLTSGDVEPEFGLDSAGASRRA